MTKQFLYIPSFDTGIAGAAGKKNIRLKDGTPWRFWSDEYPEKYRHNAFLVTGGHSYKTFDYSEKYEFNKDTIVFGDSGGYQIVSGAIKWDPKFKEIMFNWLENNSTVAMNLDLPPRLTQQGQFNYCLETSYDNFKYFADHQTGKTDFLNIIHGATYEGYSKWYQTVKGLPFKGWAIGGTGGSFNNLLCGLIVLLENGEINKKDTKWIHLLGASSVSDFLVIARIQTALNKFNPDLVLTVDSSTPSRTSAFGTYFFGYDFRRLTYQHFRIGRREKYKMDTTKLSLPIPTEISRRIWETWTFDEFIEWKSDHYGWLVNHNFSIFKDLLEDISRIANHDNQITSQLFPSRFNKLLHAIDDIFEDIENSKFKYNKWKPVISEASRLNQLENIETEAHNFFE